MINRFTDGNRFLSNFYPCVIRFRGRKYPSAEHLFQALKTTDLGERGEIRRAKTSGVARRLGQNVTLRLSWELMKEDVMLLVVFLKFKQNKKIRQALVATGKQELIEGNDWHDNHWGSCFCTSCGFAGGNRLGRILVTVRKILGE